MTAALTAVGAVIAWTRINDDVLEEDTGPSQAADATDQHPLDRWCCGVDSAPGRVPANHPRHRHAAG